LVGLTGAGAMTSINCGIQRAQELIADWDDRLSIAAVNGVSTVVISGEIAAVEELMQHCETQGIRARRIDVDYASHSQHIETIREPLIEALAAITPRSSSTEFFSTLTGERFDTTRLDAQYWYHSIRHTVQFEQALRAAGDHGYR